jgi:hypothetical protein
MEWNGRSLLAKYLTDALGGVDSIRLYSMRILKTMAAAALSACFVACFDQDAGTVHVEASVEIRVVPLTGAEPSWVPEATVIQFPNLTTLYVHPSLAAGNRIQREELREKELKSKPYLTVQVPLGSGEPVDISDRSAGNGALIVRGQSAQGRTFYLDTSGRLFTSSKGSSPLDTMVEELKGAAGR